MEPLHKSKCINHPSREAVARCPACHHFFCRECTTEHEGRIYCAVCLKQQVSAAGAKGRSTGLRMVFSNVFFTFKLLGGLLVLWMVFHLLGQLLLAIPAEFHSGKIWSDV